MASAPVVRPLPLDIRLSSDAKRSKPNSPVQQSPDDINYTNINVQHLVKNLLDSGNVDAATAAAAAGFPSPSINGSLINFGQPQQTQRPTSPSAASANNNRKQHRRNRTFGGYSCSDSSIPDLSKEDLMSGLPPLFASQLQEQMIQNKQLHEQNQQLVQQVAQQQQIIQNVLSPLEQMPVAPPQAAEPQFDFLSQLRSNSNMNMGVDTGKTVQGGGGRGHRHRRHNTIGGGFSFHNTHPVTNILEEEPLHNDITPVMSNNNRHGLLQHHDFSSLEIPDLPLDPQESHHPPAKHGRHRRVHTTGHDIFSGAIGNTGTMQDFNPNLNSFDPLPLKPVHEEHPSVSSMDEILKSLEPLNYKPSATETEHERNKSSLSDEDFCRHMMTTDDGEDNESSGELLIADRNHERNRSSLTNEDFCRRMTSTLDDEDSVGEMLIRDNNGDGGNFSDAMVESSKSSTHSEVKVCLSLCVWLGAGCASIVFSY